MSNKSHTLHMTASQAERTTQAPNVSHETLVAVLENRVQSAQGATQAWAEQMVSYVTQATEQGMTAHWARVIEQCATSLAEAATKEDTLRKILRELKG
jgi:LDH2 family malate/lactate/ureidoglycolate dehydrogenase